MYSFLSILYNTVDTIKWFVCLYHGVSYNDIHNTGKGGKRGEGAGDKQEREIKERGDYETGKEKAEKVKIDYKI